MYFTVFVLSLTFASVFSLAVAFLPALTVSLAIAAVSLTLAAVSLAIAALLLADVGFLTLVVRVTLLDEVLLHSAYSVEIPAFDTEAGGSLAVSLTCTLIYSAVDLSILYSRRLFSYHSLDQSVRFVTGIIREIEVSILESLGYTLRQLVDQHEVA